jgi:hypothetical protein
MSYILQWVQDYLIMSLDKLPFLKFEFDAKRDAKIKPDCCSGREVQSGTLESQELLTKKTTRKSKS